MPTVLSRVTGPGLRETLSKHLSQKPDSAWCRPAASPLGTPLFPRTSYFSSVGLACKVESLFLFYPQGPAFWSQVMSCPIHEPLRAPHIPPAPACWSQHPELYLEKSLTLAAGSQSPDTIWGRTSDL